MLVYQSQNVLYFGCVLNAWNVLEKNHLFKYVEKLVDPSKQFFSHVGTEPPLPGYYQYFWGLNVPCSRTQHGLTRVGL